MNIHVNNPFGVIMNKSKHFVLKLNINKYKKDKKY
jgi:hypothetical protein